MNPYNLDTKQDITDLEKTISTLAKFLLPKLEEVLDTGHKITPKRLEDILIYSLLQMNNVKRD